MTSGPIWNRFTPRKRLYLCYRGKIEDWVARKDKEKESEKRIMSKKETIELIIAVVVCASQVRSCQVSQKANEIASNAGKDVAKVEKVQMTPRLSAQIYGQSDVGKVEGRMDEVVKIPVTVFNNSDAFAYNVVLDLLFSDGTGREVSLNDYFKSINAPIIKIERLAPRDIWILPNFIPSVPNDAKSLYASRKAIFKAKLQLTWQDDSGKKYKYVNLEELKYVSVKDAKSVEGFWFESKGAYSSIDNEKDIENNWGLNFKY